MISNIYNYERKQKYIETTPEELKQNVLAFFEETAKTERLFDRELSHFLYKHLQHLFRVTYFEDKGKFYKFFMECREYFIFCEKLDGETPVALHKLFKIEYEDTLEFSRMRTEYFKDFEDLFQTLELIHNSAKTTNNTILAMDRALFFLSWYQFSPEEIAMMTTKEFDQKEGILFSPDRTYSIKIDDRVVELLNGLIPIRTCELQMGKYNQSVHTRKLEDNDFLIRYVATGGMKTTVRDPIILTRKSRVRWDIFVERYQKDHPEFSKKCMPKLILQSGRFYKMYCYEQKKGEHINYVTLEESGIIRGNMSLSGRERSIRTYNVWKNIFYNE